MSKERSRPDLQMGPEDIKLMANNLDVYKGRAALIVGDIRLCLTKFETNSTEWEIAFDALMEMQHLNAHLSDALAAFSEVK